MGSENLAGRVAVITGATRGIGRATARALAGAGVRLSLVGRSSTAAPNAVLAGTLEDVAQQAAALGAEVLPVHADLSVPEDVDRVVRATTDRFGRCDILVNNAAYTPAGAILTTPTRRWLRVLQINAVAPLQLIQGFAPGMIEAGWGRILNVSSGASVGGPPDLFVYGSSKACLDRLTTDLDAELAGVSVAVNALRVEAVATEQWHYTRDAGMLGSVNTEVFDPASVAESIQWILEQPSDFRGNIVTFERLIAEGVLRPPRLAAEV